MRPPAPEQRRASASITAALLVSVVSLACSDPGSGPPRAPSDTIAARSLAGARSFERWVALEDSGATSANVSIGDLDADGHVDILLVKGRHWPLENLVLLGDGSGGFAPAHPFGGQ